MIDKNGMVFGKINIIDLFVILVLAIFLSIGYSGYKLVNTMQEGKVTGFGQTNKWIKVRLDFSNAIPQIIAIMKEGDCEKDEFGTVIARIDKVSKTEAEVVVLADNRSFIRIRHPTNKSVMAELSLLCSVKGDKFYYNGGSLVKIGNGITLSTPIYSVTGTITWFNAE